MKIKKLTFVIGLVSCIGFALWCMPEQSFALEADEMGGESAPAYATWEDSVMESEAFQISKLSDARTDTYSKAVEGGGIEVSREDGIGFLYVKFDRVPQVWTMTDISTGQVYECGTEGFLHEYVKVEGLPAKLRLDFPAETVIADIYVFSDGQIPEWVQVWEPPCEKADLLLVSTHSDDEQLFFAGVLPYYAGELGYEVQVAYVVQHFAVGKSQNHVRPHEQLDGLWTVGVRHYPVMSDFPDVYAESKDRQTAFLQAEEAFGKYGISYQDFVAYMVGNFRRFKPLVVVSHDLDGEYGHGAHVLCASAITEAIEAAKDAEQFPQSADAYGTHEVGKVYLHLYGENKIVMDWDVPLESFGGKTAFEVTREGFDCHKSQHWTWFYGWIYGKEGRVVNKATDIRSYSPCKYGLYYSGVGPDEQGGDFFEHVWTYAQREAYIKECRVYMQTVVFQRVRAAILAMQGKQ